MNTESRGQSNQNRQKDKAWRMPANAANHRSALRHEAKMSYPISLNVKLPANSAFHAANIARALRV
jgi:hypothetical protein